MTDIKINTLGKITKGENSGWYVIVKDDTNYSGGFYILISKIPYGEFPEGFDYWVEQKNDLPIFFKEANWDVFWSE